MTVALDTVSQLARCQRLRQAWKTRALETDRMLAELRDERTRLIVLPGRVTWPAPAERWRSVCHHYLTQYGGTKYQADESRTLDLMLGVCHFESAGDPHAICRVEWIGTPPPGYDGTPATRASGLFQHIPAYFVSRAKAAGFEGGSIFDVDANVGTACWLLWDGWHPETAPNWQHWSAAHVGRLGSFEKAKAIVDPYYQ